MNTENQQSHPESETVRRSKKRPSIMRSIDNFFARVSFSREGHVPWLSLAALVAIVFVVIAMITAIISRYEQREARKKRGIILEDLPPNPGPDWGKSKSIGPSGSKSKIITIKGDGTPTPEPSAAK